MKTAKVTSCRSFLTQARRQ